MKKIMRSKITKATAFILLIACAATFGGFFTYFFDYVNNTEHGFNLTDNFKTSGYMNECYWEAIESLKYETWEEMEEKLKKIPWIKYYIVGDNIVLSNISEGVSPEDGIFFMLFDMYQTDEARIREAEKNRQGNLVREKLSEPVQNDAAAVNPDGTVHVIPQENIDAGYSYTPEDIVQSENVEIGYEVADESYDDGYDDESYDESYINILRVERYDGNERHIGKSPYTAFNSIKEAHVGMKHDYYTEMYFEWNKTKNNTRGSIIVLASLLLFAAALLAYLLAVCGRKPNDEEVHMLAIDRIFVEILVGGAFMLCLGFFAGILCGMEEVSYYSTDILLMGGLIVLCCVGVTTVITVALQSICRNIKNHTFLDRCLIARVLRFIVRLVKKLWNGLKEAFAYFCGGKVRVYILAAFILYCFILSFIAAIHSLMLFVLMIAAGCVLLYRYLSQMDKIKEGIFQIRNGNTDYRISDCKNKVFTETAEALNSINEGVKIGVEREVKAQRMKSELITNVSHDLKTPLTSIITYSDLLSSMELIPKEANDYAKIIKQKGDRLKKITSDLFDISKAESGNEIVTLEKLDIKLLIKQALAELNKEIEKSGLLFLTKLPEGDVFASGDGKKLSRVLENLVLNATKYSLSGTRVYVNAEMGASTVKIEIKNISSSAMDFDPSEITERFVRGDKNRTTEGSGLGLAIAKSYTELCGGRFEITVDGDLFKATIELNRA